MSPTEGPTRTQRIQAFFDVNFFTNLVAFAGAVLVLIAVAELASALWALLLAGLMLIVVAWALQRQEAVEDQIRRGHLRPVQQPQQSAA